MNNHTVFYSGTKNSYPYHFETDEAFRIQELYGKMRELKVLRPNSCHMMVMGQFPWDEEWTVDHTTDFRVGMWSRLVIYAMNNDFP